MSLLVGLPHHLVCHDIVDWNIVLLDDWQEIFYGAIYLILRERSLQCITLELDADGEEVAPLTTIENRLPRMPCHVGGRRQDIPGAIAVDDDVRTDLLL